MTGTSQARIGMVLGTEDVTPTVFWFAVSAGASVQLDDLVVVETLKPDGRPVRFYGLVDNVRKRHEGVTFESDVEDVVAGISARQRQLRGAGAGHAGGPRELHSAAAGRHGAARPRR